MVPHSFRHIHISALRNNNDVPLKEIQLRVGHVEVETTNGYTHLEVGTQENQFKQSQLILISLILPNNCPFLINNIKLGSQKPKVKEF